MVQFLQCIFAPVIYTCRTPISVWSSSLILFLNYSEHHYLMFPAVTHSGNVSKQAQFPPYCFLHDGLFPVHSTEYFKYCAIIFKKHASSECQIKNAAV